MINAEQPCPHLPRPKVQTIMQKEGKLYAVMADGSIRPLFYYVPLQNTVNDKVRVEAGPFWPRYVRQVVMEYLPLPDVTEGDIDEKILVNLSSQMRYDPERFTGDPIRYWNQAMFKGWPLYLHTDEKLSDTPAQGCPPGLFTQATMDMPVLIDWNQVKQKTVFAGPFSDPPLGGGAGGGAHTDGIAPLRGP